MAHRGAQNQAAAGGVADEISLADAESFEKALSVFDAQAGRIGEAVDLVRLAPAENIGRDDVKITRQRVDIVRAR